MKVKKECGASQHPESLKKYRPTLAMTIPYDRKILTAGQCIPRWYTGAEIQPSAECRGYIFHPTRYMSMLAASVIRRAARRSPG